MTVQSNQWSARRYMSLGFATLAGLIIVIYVWGVQAQIAGAIVATGRVDVESNQQVVQHPGGGVVGEILARDGDAVTAGQVVLRLDGTFLQSELSIIEGQLRDLWAREARLIAERDGANRMTLPDPLRGDPAGEKLFDGQSQLFLARRDSVAAEISQIDQQARQLDDQIIGLQAELDALIIQQDLIEQELSASESLLEKGLIQTRQVLTIRRNQAQIKGTIGRRQADIAQLRGQITAMETAKLRLATSQREQAIATLRELTFREAELVERRLSLLERRKRLDIRAPVSGVVFGSTIFAVQSVIQPAETIMSIIPSDQPLIVDARIETTDVDQIQLGQRATLRFAAFDQRRTPEVFGYVTHLSATALQDPATGQTYYEVQLIPNADDLKTLGGQVLVPGMPVDAFIQTGQRSPLTYLAKPLTDYFVKAFRED